jgi:hypothetical protein
VAVEEGHTTAAFIVMSYRPRSWFLPLLVLSNLIVSAALAAEPITLEKGTETKDAGVKTSYMVRLSDRVVPGGYLLFEQNIYGDTANGILQTIQYYLAGSDGRTLHLYRIEEEMKNLGRRTEVQRLPILLPIGPDDSSLLTVTTMIKRTTFTIRLKRNGDQSFSASVLK